MTITRALLLTAATLLLSQSVPAQTRKIEILAGKDNVFRLPGGEKVLVLKSGEKLHFRIVSAFGGETGRDGSVHSFVVKELRDQGWDIRLKEGVQEFDLTAPISGEYLIECTVKCGPGHDAMK